MGGGWGDEQLPWRPGALTQAPHPPHPTLHTCPAPLAAPPSSHQSGSWWTRRRCRRWCCPRARSHTCCARVGGGRGMGVRARGGWAGGFCRDARTHASAGAHTRKLACTRPLAGPTAAEARAPAPPPLPTTTHTHARKAIKLACTRPLLGTLPTSKRACARKSGPARGRRAGRTATPRAPGLRVGGWGSVGKHNSVWRPLSHSWCGGAAVSAPQPPAAKRALLLDASSPPPPVPSPPSRPPMPLPCRRWGR